MNFSEKKETVLKQKAELNYKRKSLIVKALVIPVGLAVAGALAGFVVAALPGVAIALCAGTVLMGVSQIAVKKVLPTINSKEAECDAELLAINNVEAEELKRQNEIALKQYKDSLSSGVCLSSSASFVNESEQEERV